MKRMVRSHLTIFKVSLKMVRNQDVREMTAKFWDSHSALMASSLSDIILRFSD